MERFVWKSRIRFVDTDATARIHYTAVFRHFEIAEDEFFRHLGFPYNTRDSALSYPRVRVEAEYLQALLYEDVVDVAVTLDRIGRSSYTLAFQMEKAGCTAARGKITVVCMELATQRSRPLPEDLVQAMALYQQPPEPSQAGG